jgi:hypothetical protein
VLAVLLEGKKVREREKERERREARGGERGRALM